jgi:hypothetical protein
MTRKSRTYTEERRTFLKKLAAAGGAGAAVVMTSRSALASADTEPAPEATKQRGYHETPHIRDYYRTAKL